MSNEKKFDTESTYMYIHEYMSTTMQKTEKQEVETAQHYPCLCAAVRKAGRVLTKRYDRHLKPSGLKVTQYSMLVNISRNPDITVTELADLLLMDQTTITRNLRVLKKSGFILVEPEASDKRTKRIQLTDFGAARMDEARPLWRKAQREMEQFLGTESIDSILGGLRKILE